VFKNLCRSLPHHVAGQDLQGHAASQRDLLGLVNHPHAAPADLAHDPVVAEFLEARHGARGRPPRVVAGVSLDLFDFDQGREHLADLVGHLRQAVDVLLEARPLAPAKALGKLLGELIEPVVVA
jgi:hypothetical protein